MSKGSVYIAVNEYLPDLVKIGRSADPAQRMIELSHASGVPGRFTLAHAVRVADMRDVEARMHRRFAARRVRGSEFFRLSVRQARAELDRMASRERTRRLLTGLFVPRNAPMPLAVRGARLLVTAPLARPRTTAALVSLAAVFGVAGASPRGASGLGLAVLFGCAVILVAGVQRYFRHDPGRGVRRARPRKPERRWSAAETISLLVGITIALGLVAQQHGAV